MNWVSWQAQGDVGVDVVPPSAGSLPCQRLAAEGERRAGEPSHGARGTLVWCQPEPRDAASLCVMH